MDDELIECFLDTQRLSFKFEVLHPKSIGSLVSNVLFELIDAPWQEPIVNSLGLRSAIGIQPTKHLFSLLLKVLVIFFDDNFDLFRHVSFLLYQKSFHIFDISRNLFLPESSRPMLVDIVDNS
jgi:hypothetical protein